MDIQGIRSQAKYIGISAQKARLVIDLVRGKPAKQALTLLQFTSKEAAREVAKVLKTAIANAEENFELNADDLIVSQAFVDEAPTRKWRRFGARGRFKQILRRSSHITIVVQSKEA